MNKSEEICTTFKKSVSFESKVSFQWTTNFYHYQMQELAAAYTSLPWLDALDSHFAKFAIPRATCAWTSGCLHLTIPNSALIPPSPLNFVCSLSRWGHLTFSGSRLFCFKRNQIHTWCQDYMIETDFFYRINWTNSILKNRAKSELQAKSHKLQRNSQEQQSPRENMSV